MNIKPAVNIVTTTRNLRLLPKGAALVLHPTGVAIEMPPVAKQTPIARFVRALAKAGFPVTLASVEEKARQVERRIKAATSFAEKFAVRPDNFATLAYAGGRRPTGSYLLEGPRPGRYSSADLNDWATSQLEPEGKRFYKR